MLIVKYKKVMLGVFLALLLIHVVNYNAYSEKKKKPLFANEFAFLQYFFCIKNGWGACDMFRKGNTQECNVFFIKLMASMFSAAAYPLVAKL
jgi:hypothetical protein